eukprot:826604-Rhodomonas_salina.1
MLCSAPDSRDHGTCFCVAPQLAPTPPAPPAWTMKMSIGVDIVVESLVEPGASSSGGSHRSEPGTSSG